MPGRLLAFVKATPSPPPKATKEQAHNLATALLPPYSVAPPPLPPKNTRTKSQESLVMDVFHHKFGSSKKKAAPAPAPACASIDMTVESPPVVFYNGPAASTGALFSGQLKVDVTEPHILLRSFEMRLISTVTTKKPVSTHCPDCLSQTTEIHKWEFLAVPMTMALNHGEHAFPFSHLIPGHLPASSHGSLATLTYHLEAVATTSTGERILFDRAIVIKRAIFPGNEKRSIRIFPPTNLTVSVTLPPVIHPMGDFPIEMRISGIVTNTPETQSRWRLRKLNWRIEETQKFISPACSKHIQKVHGEGKGVQHGDMHIIGSEEVKSGWKTDISEGNIDCEFRAAVNPMLKSVCDMESSSGMSVKHNLIIEMVVVEEFIMLKRPSHAAATGAARILRTQFHIVLSERCGMGISWDEEQPPLYEDVPGSPPGYLEDFDADNLSARSSMSSI